LPYLDGSFDPAAMIRIDDLPTMSLMNIALDEHDSDAQANFLGRLEQNKAIRIWVEEALFTVHSNEDRYGVGSRRWDILLLYLRARMYGTVAASLAT
jgi:hypothetical protein